jgi:hypothetical protein
MDSIVDPAADYIWGSVETVVDAEGVHEKAPHTDEDWKNLRRHAIMLLEAPNLLQVPGRRVAKTGEKAENPEVELAPEQIQQAIDRDRASWQRYAQGLHDAAMLTLRAIAARNTEQLVESGDALDAACENCHKHYWYLDENALHAPSPRKSQ